MTVDENQVLARNFLIIPSNPSDDRQKNMMTPGNQRHRCFTLPQKNLTAAFGGDKPVIPGNRSQRCFTLPQSTFTAAVAERSAAGVSRI